MLSMYVAIMLGLIFFCIILLLVLIKLNKKNSQQIEIMIEKWQEQNRYMNNTVDICNKALELTEEIKGSIDSTQVEGQKEHVKKCNDLLTSMNGADTAIGVLLSEKKRLCREKNIDFIDEATFIPTEGCIKEVDAVSVIGNLLDNAIEGALRAIDKGTYKYVKLVSRKNKNVWMIKVMNTKSREVTVDSLIRTEKADKENHGFGIGIVNMVADKYNGTVKIVDKKESFEVSVYMVMKKSKHA